MIWGENLRNARIYGPGTLDGCALTNSAKVSDGTRIRAIALKGCKNVEIRNLNINEGGHIAMVAADCEDLLIDNVTINTSRDGINLLQCSEVEVAYCHIDAVRYEDGQPVGGGDAIKFGSYPSSNNNVTVHDCYLAAGGHGLQIDSKTVGPLSDYRFENIRIRQAHKADTSRTTIDGVHSKDMRMEIMPNLKGPN